MKKTQLDKPGDFKKLAIGTDLYRPTKTNVNGYYFAGMNPESEDSIMLISHLNVQDIHGEYVDENFNPLYTNYHEACNALVENAEKNLEKVKKIYQKK